MTELRMLVGDELRQAVEPEITLIADAIAAKHGQSSLAVLFYGSCLREKRLDGLMLDFYLIVSDYRSAYPRRWLAAANRLIPPNVFYFEHRGLVSKYAVLSEQDFARECSPDARTVSTAARFAQPSRLVFARDRDAARRTLDAVAEAAPTLLGWTMPLVPGAAPTDLWKQAFRLTFEAELRAERSNRPDALVEADLPRYERFGRAARKVARPTRTKASAAAWWQKMQRRGKLYSIVRLAKASFTFAGGADYIAWKINRHSNAAIQLKPWQRRHPLIAAISLLPRLLMAGAVR